jgi:S-adenosylmethionine:tRNA ribosyltransferase-isomerase
MSISADTRHQSNAYSSTAPLSFKLPPGLTAGEPAERRGIARDGVRLMVIDRASYEIEHTQFYSLGKFLKRGDLLVFNSSRTIPASLIGYKIPVREGIVVEVRLAERLSDDSWLALIIHRDGDGKATGSYDLCPYGPLNGVEVEFGHGLVAKVYDRDKNIPTLWKIRFSQSGIRFMESLYLLGQPVRYEYVSKPWDLDYYQTVYAREPGSVEMPSA